MQPIKPIIYIPDQALRKLVVSELAAQGIKDARAVHDIDTCIESLVLDNSSMLVMDMTIGSEVINQILSASKTHFKIETRPILIFVSELDSSILATASEYNVSQLHVGEPNSDTVHLCIKQLVRELNSTSMARSVLLKVATARSRGDWAVVTPLLKEEYEKNPSDERLAIELAENLVYERSWRAASQVLAPYLKTEPPLIRALNLKARCLMAEGKHTEAAQIMERAKLLNPHNVDRLIEFGHILISVDRIGEARQQFEEATTLDNDNADAARGVGQCMLMQGEVNEALDFLKGSSGPRELASVFNSAAIMSIHNGYFKKGMTLYKKAFEVIGEDEKVAARLMFNMGLGYKKSDDLKNAISCFDKSTKLDPTFAKAIQQIQSIEKTSRDLHPEVFNGRHEEVTFGGESDDTAEDFDEEDFTTFRAAMGD